ncbi:MAG: DUF4369 domain-containing protein [Bacteroidaceae bacterium]|nr:DUF4369 domain-containing protein [Bacteroidaceae bacterium]
MSSLLIYAIKSAILLTLLFVPGIFLIFREKMFRFNRLTLLAILVLSLVLPLCNFSYISMDNVPAVQTLEKGLLELGVPVEGNGLTPYPSPVGEGNLEKPFPWFYVVSILYAIGALTILGIRLREVLSMGRIIRRGSIWTKDDTDGIRIYCHAENVAPFSWLRSIVISEQDYNENGREIILHEKAHILYRHSLDIILLTLVETIQWWNPFAYLLGIYLRDVHEYEADDYVLREGISAHSYSQLIIKKAVGASTYTFANNFNHSLTKKRISMMLKTNPHRGRRSRVLYLLPMIALALSAFATSEFQTASELIEQKVNASSTTFTLKGTVKKELNVDHYIVYIWDYSDNVHPDPIDTVYVKDGKFEFSRELDQAYSGMLKAVLKDGTLGEQFQEIFFVPGETCNMELYGTKFEDFNVSGSKFYRDWAAFREFYLKESQKAIDLQGAGDKAYKEAIAEYNRKHKDEEGCIMYQYMWLVAGIADGKAAWDLSIADGIQEGRFKNYINFRRSQVRDMEEKWKNEVDIQITKDEKLYVRQKGEQNYKPINPKELMQILSKYKYKPAIVNIYSDKEMEHLEQVAKEACRKNNLLKINYSVLNKE